MFQTLAFCNNFPTRMSGMSANINISWWGYQPSSAFFIRGCHTASVFSCQPASIFACKDVNQHQYLHVYQHRYLHVNQHQYLYVNQHQYLHAGMSTSIDISLPGCHPSSKYPCTDANQYRHFLAWMSTIMNIDVNQYRHFLAWMSTIMNMPLHGCQSVSTFPCMDV